MSTAPVVTAWTLELDLLRLLSELDELPADADASELLALIRDCIEQTAEKRDALAFAYERRAADVAALYERADDARHKATQAEARLERFERYILTVLEIAGEDRLPGLQKTLSRQRNPGKVKTDETFNLAGPLRFKRLIPAEYEPDKKAIKAAIEAGETVPGAWLTEGAFRLVIR